MSIGEKVAKGGLKTKCRRKGICYVHITRSRSAGKLRRWAWEVKSGRETEQREGDPKNTVTKLLYSVSG